VRECRGWMPAYSMYAKFLISGPYEWIEARMLSFKFKPEA